ncbi:hypothetical protein LZ30DRAFT_727458, partial [Colletotrichum cereale]
MVKQNGPGRFTSLRLSSLPFRDGMPSALPKTSKVVRIHNKQTLSRLHTDRPDATDEGGQSAVPTVWSPPPPPPSPQKEKQNKAKPTCNAVRVLIDVCAHPDERPIAIYPKVDSLFASGEVMMVATAPFSFSVLDPDEAIPPIPRCQPELEIDSIPHPTFTEAISRVIFDASLFPLRTAFLLGTLLGDMSVTLRGLV